MTTAHVVARMTMVRVHRLADRYRWALVIFCAVCAFTTVMRPVFIDGNALHYTPFAAAVETITTAFPLILICSALLPLLTLGYDADNGLRSVLLIGGCRPWVSAVRDLFAATVMIGTTIVGLGFCGALASLCESLGRNILGVHANAARVHLGATTHLLVEESTIAFGVGLVFWLMVLACNSGRKAVIASVALVLTLAVPVTTIPSDIRSWMALHPLAWTLQTLPKHASILDIDAPTWVTTTTGVLGGCILATVAFTRLFPRP